MITNGFRRFLWVFFVLVASVSYAGAADDYLDKAYQRVAEGDERAAIELFRKAAERDPNNAVIQYELGVMLGCEKGIRHYKKAVTIDRSFWRAHFNAGICYRSSNDLKSAQASFRDALNGTDQKAVVLDALGTVLSMQGKDNHALELFRNAKHLAPDDPIIRYHIGNWYVEHGQYQQGRQELMEALNIDPKFYKAALNLAESYRFEGKYNQQLDYLEKAISIDPSHPAAYINHTTPLLELGQKDRAFQLLVKGTQLAAQQGDALMAEAALTNLQAEFPNAEITEALEDALNGAK